VNAGHRDKNSFISLSYQPEYYQSCRAGDYQCKFREESPILLPEPACAQRCPEGDFQCNYFRMPEPANMPETAAMPEPACNTELCPEDDFTCNTAYDDYDLPEEASVKTEKYSEKANSGEPGGKSLPEPACSGNRCRSNDFRCQYNSYLVSLPEGHDTKHHSRMFKNAAKHLLKKYTQEHLMSILSGLNDK